MDMRKNPKATPSQQSCKCGWSKITTQRGLRIHQGRKKCLLTQEQEPRIDQHFLRSQSSQSTEVQRRDENHRPPDINASASRVRTTRNLEQESEKNLQGRRPMIQWPRSSEKAQWKLIDSDLCHILNQLNGSVVYKLDKLGDLIYDYGSQRFGVEEYQQKQVSVQTNSRRQREIDQLVRERRQLKKRWRKSGTIEKEPINQLYQYIKEKLASLRKAERFRKRRKKKERARTKFHEDPFKFIKNVFAKEKNGQLDVSKVELEDHLEKTYSSDANQTNEPMVLPSDMPPRTYPVVPFVDTQPKWSEVEASVKKGRSSSAPGPNGISYKVYKNTPGVLRLLWKLMRTVWLKQTIPKAWRRAGGIFIPKEKNSATIGQFRPISLLNDEGKIFFSILAKRLSTFLLQNNYVDTSVQKAGVPGFSGCIEHQSVIWQQIQTAKKEKKELHVVFLDLANAYGSVPHELIWIAFEYFNVPETVTNLVKAYFEDIQYCFSTNTYTTKWQHLGVGIMAGCTVSPLAFTMAMEIIIRASKWVVGGEQLASGLKLPPIRAFMDDMTTLTKTIACTNRLLGKLAENIKWARMKFKAVKSRSISIVRGRIVDHRFVINEEGIPTVSEQPVKSLGRWYDGDLKDTVRVSEIRQQVTDGLKRLDSCDLPGKLKVWGFQFGLLPRLLWPLTVYEVPLSTVERLEAVIRSFLKKWLGLPRCLSRIGMYTKSVLQLPVSSLTEEFKCAKVRLVHTLAESKDECVREVSPSVKSGRKWNAKQAAADARVQLQTNDIIGQVQHGRGGFGLSSARPRWSDASPAEKRKLVVNEIHREEEKRRSVTAVTQAKQCSWMRWESVNSRKVTWSDLWTMEQKRISFLIRSTYDVLPTPANLQVWTGEDPACCLCSGIATLKHILAACKVSLSQGRYTWRHDQVLKYLVTVLEEQVNSGKRTGCIESVIPFVRSGEKPKSGERPGGSHGILGSANDWCVIADTERRLVFPQHIVKTSLRPDIVLWSNSSKSVILVELTVPWEELVDEAFERKKLRYAELCSEIEENGWRSTVYPVEVGCRGFVAHSTTKLLKVLGFSGNKLMRIVKALSEIAEKSSNWLWLKRKASTWGPK